MNFTTLPRIVIAGGNGFLGKHLHQHLTAEGYQVLLLSRREQGKDFVPWDANSLGDWTQYLEGAHALINMVGRTVNCRYNERNKREIMDSRVDSTRLLGEAIKRCKTPPKFWLNSSTATIYPSTYGDAPANTEQVIPTPNNFSEQVATAWEKAFFEYSQLPQTHKIALRTSIVLGKDGGAFPVMRDLARWGLCSPQGSGEQWISWVHIADFCAAVSWVMQHRMEGVVNICVPQPTKNKDFNRTLGKRLKPWLVLPQPVWLLKLGAMMIGTETELILKSRKVSPERLLQSGFTFRYVDVEAAFEDLC